MSVFVRLLNPLLMIALGLGLGVYLARRFGLEWRLYGIGALTFIASQAFHLPFNAWLLAPWLGRLGITVASQGRELAVAALAFGLSAGLFEETARYLVYRRWLKTQRSWEEALMFGAGHGGSEAVILGLLTLFSVIQLIALRGKDLSGLVAAEQLEIARAQIATFWAMPWYAVLLGAVERAATLCFHLSMAVIVLQVFTRGRLAWWGLAVFLHTLVNALAVFAGRYLSMYLTEGLVVLFALGSLWIAFRLRPAETPEEEPLDQPPSSPQVFPHPLEITPESIEESRYEP